MPATIKVAAATVRALGVFVPTFAGGVVLEHKATKDKTEIEAKRFFEGKGDGKPKELATNELPNAPKFH